MKAFAVWNVWKFVQQLRFVPKQQQQQQKTPIHNKKKQKITKNMDEWRSKSLRAQIHIHIWWRSFFDILMAFGISRKLSFDLPSMHSIRKMIKLLFIINQHLFYIVVNSTQALHDRITACTVFPLNSFHFLNTPRAHRNREREMHDRGMKEKGISWSVCVVFSLVNCKL